MRGVLDNNTDTGSQFNFLASNGMDVRLKPSSVVGLFHHKYAVIDAELSTAPQYVITGSHNWSSAAENSNNENTLVIQSNRIVNQYLQEFAARYKEAGGGDNIVVDVEQTGDRIPLTFSLSHNYPNPFNPITNFEIRLPAGQAGISKFEFVEMRVFDLLGREVVTLIQEYKPPGVYRVQMGRRGCSKRCVPLRIACRPIGGYQADGSYQVAYIILTHFREGHLVRCLGT